MNGAIIFSWVLKSLDKLSLEFKNLMAYDKHKLTLNTIFESLMFYSI